MNFILLALLVLATQAGAETYRLPSEARLWLKVPAGQAPLHDVRVSSGTAAQASWEQDPAVRERHTDILFPVRWWSWTELTVHFTPAQDGTVELSLLGPWAADENGGMPRQEIQLRLLGSRTEPAEIPRQLVRVNDVRPAGNFVCRCPSGT